MSNLDRGQLHAAWGCVTIAALSVGTVAGMHLDRGLKHFARPSLSVPIGDTPTAMLTEFFRSAVMEIRNTRIHVRIIQPGMTNTIDAMFPAVRDEHLAETGPGIFVHGPDAEPR